MGFKKDLDVIIGLIKEELYGVKGISAHDIDNAIYFAVIKIFGLKMGYNLYIDDNFYKWLSSKIKKEVLIWLE